MSVKKIEPILDSHTRIILERYAVKDLEFKKNNYNSLYDRYLKKVLNKTEIRDKYVLEIGAGCSQYSEFFLDSDCVQYYANDLIPDRLNFLCDTNPRINKCPGDFRFLNFDRKFDIVFANLTMMFVIPQLEDFILKIKEVLDEGGVFICMDPNYLSPITIYRHFSDRAPNPAVLFSPFRFAKIFEKNGFKIKKLKPCSGRFNKILGNWFLSTNFIMRAELK